MHSAVVRLQVPPTIRTKDAPAMIKLLTRFSHSPWHSPFARLGYVDGGRLPSKPFARMPVLWAWLLALAVWFVMLSPAFAEQAPAVSPAQAAKYAAWIQQMKTSRKGPFYRIRWFCNDGAILEPKPYACSDHGGGIQHGQWSDQLREIRAAGWQIANVLGEYGREKGRRPTVSREQFKQILMERFLVGYDQGWIFRRARYYRGALQREDEARGEVALVEQWAARLNPDTQDYLLLWEAARLLPGPGKHPNRVTEMRDLATQINSQDANFEALRTKLHADPALADAQAIRQYAATQGAPALQNDYARLATVVESVFETGTLSDALRGTAKHLHHTRLKKYFRQQAATLEHSDAAFARLQLTAQLLETLRMSLPSVSGAGDKQRLLRLGQQIERVVFAELSGLQADLPKASRAERLRWLKEVARSLYGVGLLSAREWQAVQDSLAQLQGTSLSLRHYAREVDYLGRVPQWSTQWLKFHFGEVVTHFAQIEPLSQQMIPARLRGSALHFYSVIIATLKQDADRLSGRESQLFDAHYATGLRALNPGLARGRLREPPVGKAWDSKGIYLLKETTSTLPPVAGIITLDEGNALSHVQLLAANLGIPNVVVSHARLPRLRAHLGEPVVMAVSPGGVVRITTDDASWDAVFETADIPTSALRPNLAKLDLTRTEFLSLSDLRARDSGVIVGPKAANLGELKHFFPDAVSRGLVVPFGRFRAFLEQPLPGTGMTAFAWMKAYYRYIRSVTGEERQGATQRFLSQFHHWIETSTPGVAFRQELAQALENEFGPDGSYALFVRSDTNMEDLPGFTGAGLNKTVPNVVGLDAVIKAIMQVWASPFTERAFAWRQQRMATPENVYPSVLLLETVPVEKSGVLLTFNKLNGEPDAFTVAVSRGIGGAVQGESAEELLVEKSTGRVRLLASATSPRMRIAAPEGGLRLVPVQISDTVLQPDEIERLRSLVQAVELNLPQFDAQGHPTPADIEFGFRQGHLALFQIRPFLRDKRARQSQYLLDLDRQARPAASLQVDMTQVVEVTP